MQRATFACGCFWGIESIFGRVKGVVRTTAVYASSCGTIDERPAYPAICDSNRTKLAEAIDITFDSSLVSYDQLLGIFWASHDPTSQLWTRATGVEIPRPEGSCRGTSAWQYRSEIFPHDQLQLALANTSIAQQHQQEEAAPILTRACPPGSSHVYTAEAYHQKYLLQSKAPLLFASLELSVLPLSIPKDDAAAQFDSALLDALTSSTIAARLCGLVGASITLKQAECIIEELVVELTAPQRVVEAATTHIEASFAGNAN